MHYKCAGERERKVLIIMKMKSTKHALLLSGLALVLCLSMLIGTTFAWFTDSVTSGSNVIQAGTLDIVMEYWDGDSWEDAEGQVLEFRKGGNYHGYTGEVLWEPGCTYELPKIRIRNEGNLAAKVLLRVNGITGDEKLLEAIDFTTKVENIPASLKTGSAGATFAAMEGQSYGFVYGTADGTVMMDWTVMAKGHTSLNTGHTDTSAEFTISGHMKKEAGNEYQGLKIEGVSITALATQSVYEYDSFDREYDENAPFPEVTVVSNADELKATLAAGKNVVVGSDIDLGGTTITVPANVTATLDLNGRTISDSATGTGEYMLIVENSAKLTITDSIGTGKITFASIAPAGSKAVGAVVHAKGELVMESGTLEMTGAWEDSFVVTVHPNAWGSAYTAPTTFTMNGGKIISSDSGVRVTSFSDNRYTDDFASFIMNGGSIDSAKDGIFVQQPEAVWDALNVTVNGGVIEGDRNPIRICIFGFTSSDVEKCITIDLSSNATLTYTGSDTPTDWIVDGKIRYSCYGGTLDDIQNHTTITVDGVVQ